MRPTGWHRAFNDPFPLPKGKKRVTLGDASNYITKLSKAEHDAEEWQAAMGALLLVAELKQAVDEFGKDCVAMSSDGRTVIAMAVALN